MRVGDRNLIIMGMVALAAVGIILKWAGFFYFIDPLFWAGFAMQIVGMVTLVVMAWNKL